MCKAVTGSAVKGLNASVSFRDCSQLTHDRTNIETVLPPDVVRRSYRRDRMYVVGGRDANRQQHTAVIWMTSHPLVRAGVRISPHDDVGSFQSIDWSRKASAGRGDRDRAAPISTPTSVATDWRPVADRPTDRAARPSAPSVRDRYARRTRSIRRLPGAGVGRGAARGCGWCGV